jgi:hypothetical protein
VKYNIVWTLAALLALPSLSAAQEAPPTLVNQGGPMTVEAIRQHFAIAPEYKVSKLGDTTAQLVGAHGGIFVTRDILVGAAFYTMTNGEEGRSGLTYGGAVFGWQPFTTGAFGVNLRGLIGFGSGTTSDTVTLTTHDRRGVPIGTQEGIRWYSSGLFVAEPQVDLVVGLTKLLHLQIGGGYRFADADHVDHNRFSGASGSIALRIGSAR